MKISPEETCEYCRSFVEIIGGIMESLDIVVPLMDAAVAAKDKPKALYYRDEVLKLREQLISYANHMAEHEANRPLSIF